MGKTIFNPGQIVDFFPIRNFAITTKILGNIVQIFKVERVVAENGLFLEQYSLSPQTSGLYEIYQTLLVSLETSVI